MKPDNCPSCKESDCIFIAEKSVTINVREENIAVYIEFYQCKFCKIKFDDVEAKDELSKAYNVYRKKRNMVVPERFTKWRESLGFSIEEMSYLLNWTPIKLGLFENGLLQTDEEDMELRKIMAY